MKTTTRRNAAVGAAVLTGGPTLIVPEPSPFVIARARSGLGASGTPGATQAGVNILASVSSSASSVSPLGFAPSLNPAVGAPVDERTAIQGALAFLSSRQDEAGSIGGFYVSAWSLMAFNKLPSNWFSEFPQLDGVLEGLLEYNSDRARAFLAGQDEKQLNSVSQTTEGNRILLADPYNRLGEDLKYAVWEKAQRLSGRKRTMNDTHTVWRAFMIILMQRNGWTNSALYDQLIGDLKSLQKSDGGWSEGGFTVGHVDHSAAVMTALANVNPTFFEARRDSTTGGFRGPGDMLSVESTAWAVMALANIDRLAMEFLRRNQHPDGSIAAFQTENLDAKIWPTALALSALCGPGF